MTRTRTGEPRTAGFVTWLVLAASFILSADTWHALGQLAGFGDWLSWLMPVAVDGYVTVALILWTAPVPAKVARFARTNTYAGALVGVSAQSSFHALTIYSGTGLDWRVYLAAVVGALPPAVAGLAVHMRSLVRRESALRSTVTERETHRSPIVEVPRPVPPLPLDLPQVAAPITPTTLPAPVPSPEAAPVPTGEPARRARKSAGTSVPRRSFAVTQQAAAAMEAGGMDLPTIALTLGVTERQARNALRAAKTTGGDDQAERVNGAEVEMAGVIA